MIIKNPFVNKNKELDLHLEFDFSQLNNLFNFEFLMTKEVIKIYSVPLIFDKNQRY